MATRKRKRRGKPVTDPNDGRRKGFANLKPIQPGEVRNPEGKNGSEWLKAFRRFWEGVPDGDDVLPDGLVKSGEDRYMVGLRALFRNVALGNEQSIKLMVEQLQGRARQHIELSGDVGNGPPVQFMLPENGRDVEPAAVQDGDDDKVSDDAGNVDAPEPPGESD